MKTEHIYECQNDELLLKCLYAQRRKYTQAKKRMSWKRNIVFVSTVISVVLANFNCSELATIPSFVAIWVLFIGKRLDRCINTKKEEAAEIQQYFDVSLYSRACAFSSGKWGNILTDSQIAEHIKRVFSMNLAPFKNWYSDYSSCEPCKEIFRCQNENICWDAELRKKYICVEYVIIVVFALLSVGLAWYRNINIFIVISWILPIFDYCSSNIFSLQNDIKRLGNIRKKIISYESKSKYIKKTEKISSLVEIQYMIKEHRINCFLIPDWFYKSNKEKQQMEADNSSRYC